MLLSRGDMSILPGRPYPAGGNTGGGRGRVWGGRGAGGRPPPHDGGRRQHVTARVSAGGGRGGGGVTRGEGEGRGGRQILTLGVQCQGVVPGQGVVAATEPRFSAKNSFKVQRQGSVPRFIAMVQCKSTILGCSAKVQSQGTVP